MAVAYTKAVFLRGISMVYMFAFTSLYVQIPGLYGIRGILPAHLELQCRKGDALVECFKQKPTLLWFAPAFGLDVSSGMEVLAVFGAVLAFIGFVWVEVCTALLMLALWAFYYSLVAAGSTFMHFQWDILLLEAGFLAILAAPFWMGKSAAKPSTKDDLVMWMVRWLLFRLMFASGVVKLLSNCPTWWGLTALSWHYESQCIPTPLAWFAHQLPTWFQQLSTAATFLIEIPIPVLFFSPVRNVRLFAFYCQQIFQIAIMLTGNYNFFNILTLVLCVSLLDDEWFFGKRSRKSRTGWLASLVNVTIAGFLYLSVYLFATEYFSLSFDGGIPRSKVAFTPAEFRKALSFAVPIMAVGAALLLLVKLLTGFYQSLKQIRSLLSYVIVAALSCLLFTASLVPFTSVEPLTQTRLPRVAKNLYGSLDQWNLVNSYGLFRSMTGVGGRPEIIVEGADSGGNPSWKEIPFRYKPGPVDEPPPFVAPHQPRLDWQMWFAALSRAEHNPWLYSFVYRVLEGSPDVLKLLEPGVKPPKQIKVDSYLYHYTRKDSSNRNDSVNWWKRDTRKEYLKPVTKDSPEMAMIASISRTTDPRKVHPSWRVVLDPLRSYSDRVPPHVLIWSLLVAALCLVFFGSMRK